MSCILQLASCVHVCCSYSWASCMQTITEAIFYIPKKKNRSRNLFFSGAAFKVSGANRPSPPVYFEGCYLPVFLMNTITSAHKKKNLPIPDVTLKNRGIGNDREKVQKSADQSGSSIRSRSSIESYVNFKMKISIFIINFRGKECIYI